ncbi:hypothetical protein MNV49_007966 [Pseudohyphozyma bogoriensis]|nr:hypothetical protein MNV49_007966 [Pseudohyphozyma bogoriensis]
MGKDKTEKKDKKSKKSTKAADEPAAAAPALSSFLLAQTDKDSALDDIFANSKGPSEVLLAKPAPKPAKNEKKTTVAAPGPAPALAADDDDEDDVANDAELSELDSDEELPSDIEALAADDSDDDGVEQAYAAQRAAAKLKALAEGVKTKKGKNGGEEESGDESEEGDEEEEELDIDNLVHESLLPTKVFKEVKLSAKEIKKSKEKKDKEIDETPEERDARTVFLGNVPVECSTSKSMKKSLIRHVLQSPALLELLPPTCPPLKATSIRFRSLAFASTIFARKAEPVVADDGTVTEAGGRGRKRAREWRNDESTDERGVRGGFREKEKAAPAKPSGSGALTDGQKRRVAFIKGDMNEHKKVCNAYLVVDPLPASFTELSLKDVCDLIISTTNGTTFEGFTLRADSVRPRSAAAALAAAQLAAKPTEKEVLAQATATPNYQVPAAEARRTMFMGGLDFAETEENVRAATEKVLERERGKAGEKGWVEGVRLIRDASTGLGKGFGYVLLKNAECVDELLALPEGKPLKISKRKPRMERCKTGIAAARAKAASIAARAGDPTAAAKKAYSDREAAPLPPMKKPRFQTAQSESASEHQAKLAEALAKLPAEERKKIKAVDPERLMRRAEKKKNKVLAERFERKQKNAGKAEGILGRETRREVRNRKEKARVKAGNKTGKRYTGKPKK